MYTDTLSGFAQSHDGLGQLYAEISSSDTRVGSALICVPHSGHSGSSDMTMKRLC
jgi:hypothetical protein